MSPGFSTDFKELVRSRTDIVELIGETVRLDARRGGREHVGLCPFHDDHKPSMTVDRERQSYKCWSCGEGGDCFSFVMKIDGLQFSEALEHLANRAHVEIPANFRQKSGENGRAKTQLYEVLTWAAGEFHQFLRTSAAAKAARAYLQTERRFSDEMIAKFHVGYHPDDWEWVLKRAAGRFSPEQLFAARLVRERRDGNGHRDDFVDRVLFPIRDERARVVAFGGRLLPGHRYAEAPKYLNSPESQIFAKSRLLYGLDVAREGIRRSGTAVVVEGYTDCVMAHQCGLENVVGTLGTALSETHVRTLKRFARKVVLVFDGDNAGQAAAERSLVQFLAQDVDLRILTLPEGLDPADFLAANNSSEFQTLIDGAVEAWEYKLRHTFDRFGVETIDSRKQVFEEMLDLLIRVPRFAGTERENIVLGRLAHRVGIDERTVRQRLGQARRQHANRENSRVRVDPNHEVKTNDLANGKLGKDDHVEFELLEIIFADPQTVADIRSEVQPAAVRNDQLRTLLELCYGLWERGIAPAYEKVTAELEDLELKRLAVTIDEHSRVKGILKLLHKDEETRGHDKKPEFLEQAIANLKWRETVQSHEVSKGKMAQLTGTSVKFDEDAKALLRRVTEFHKKRAAKKNDDTNPGGTASA